MTQIVSGFLFIAGALILVRTLAAASRRQRQQANNAPLTSGELTKTTQLTRKLDEMEVRVYDFHREVEGRLQTQIAALQYLLDEADRQIVRLEGLLAAQEARNSAASPTCGQQPDQQQAA